jgi:hypothetical protein
LNQESWRSAQPRGLFKDSNGIPHFDDGTRSWPLIFDTSEITDIICRAAIDSGDKECMDQMQAMSEYILNLDSHEEIQFKKVAVGMVYKWFTDHIDYLQDHIHYEIVSEMRPANIFGVVKYNTKTELSTVRVYVMNDFSTRMYAHKLTGEERTKVRLFRFFEEDFWNIIEPDFLYIYATFGGWNVSRKNFNKYRTVYRVGKVLVEPYNRNPQMLPDKTWLSRRDLNYMHVTTTPIEEVLAEYDIHTKLENIVENGIKSSELIPLFDLVESYNLATIITYAHFQKFKYIHREQLEYVYEEDSNLPIEWYIKEDGVRFQKFRGKIWDNKLESQISADHAIDLLNMFEQKESDQVEQLTERVSELESQIEDMEFNQYIVDGELENLRNELAEAETDIETANKHIGLEIVSAANQPPFLANNLSWDMVLPEVTDEKLH